MTSFQYHQRPGQLHDWRWDPGYQHATCTRCCARLEVTYTGGEMAMSYHLDDHGWPIRHADELPRCEGRMP